MRNTKAQLKSQGIDVSLNMTGMETDAEARAVLEIIRRNAGPGCFDTENTEDLNIKKRVQSDCRIKTSPTLHAVKLLTPGGHGRTSVYSSEYRQDYENDSSTDEEPMEDNSSDEEGDFVSK